MNNIAIKVSNLTKVYKLYDKPQDRLKEALHPFKKKYHKDFHALSDVSFEIKKGETVGIIGKNGAGKSTLLKIITGVLTPTSGNVHVNGRIASLLELGAGFNPEYTGVENIYLQGTLMGLSHREMETKVDEILAFADIDDFIHQPVKMYSSGMYARLAFAVAINVEPDILIVDEALSVGDMRFQQKCYRKFREFQESKKTILFVTHDTSTIINYCTYVIWMNDGKKVDEGNPDIVCKKYMSSMFYDQETIKNNFIKENNSEQCTDNIKWINDDGLESFGEKGVIITQVALVDKDNNSKEIFEGGERVTFKIKMYSSEHLNNLIAGFTVYDNLGNPIFGSNTYVHKFGMIKFNKDKSYIIDFEFDIPYLRNGDFSISPAIAEGIQSEHIQHHWIHNMFNFKIRSISEESNMGWLILKNDIIIKVEDE